ncbi:MAG: phosphoglycerate mutase (2,3-diphosphoglycerate-independent) [Deltaproteobacteria bacterium]|nr:phosphoglycerate mutase (2,3-diphosphoglycerate-independent) [Deltaproteobacteria bacterium]
MLIHKNIELAIEIERLYQQGLSDYDMEPLVMVDSNQVPVGRIQNGDTIIFCCKRGEREVQLTRSFVDPSFNEFKTSKLNNIHFISFTLYHNMFLKMPVEVAFPQAHVISDTIGDVISKNGLRQLRVAESEKFAHVTFFLNGNNNHIFPGEDHIQIPSIKGVSFDQVPELSSKDVAGAVIGAIQKDMYNFIVVNFPNGDMIGHLENQEAKMKCAEAVDRQLGNVLSAADSAGYVTLITADHGILESSFHPDGTPNLSHTKNPVPFIMVDPDLKKQTEIQLINNRTLADVAPTALHIMKLPVPELMTGKNLILGEQNLNVGRKVLLVVLDGWGIGKSDKTNPIFSASTPVYDRLIAEYPFTRLEASGSAVGLMDWKAGNSEAGHQTIGAGRTVLQDDVRIESSIEDGSFFENTAFLTGFAKAKANKGALHLISLLSEKSSHGSIGYPIALLRLAKEQQVQSVYVHAIFDGRSTKVRSAIGFIEKIQNEMNKLGIGKFATGIGRGFALDRNGNYRKTQKAYNALVFGKGRKVIPM